MEKEFDILGLGYCGLDYSCLLPRIPIDDKIQALKTLIQGGGPAATATYAAAKLGAKAAFAGCVGDDSSGRAIVEAFQKAGVDTRALVVRAGSESPLAFCWTEAPSGKRSIAWTKGAVKPLAPSELPESLIASSRILHLDGHQTEAAIHAAKIARKHGVAVCIDAGTIVDGIGELLSLSDIVIASEKFAERFTGLKDPEASAKCLFGANCRFAGVTLGHLGSYGFDGKEIFHQPSFKVDVVDTTGAGDVYHGAFVYECARGGSWASCMRFAAAVAALKCTAFGGRTGIPTLEEAMRFLSEQSQNVS